MDHFSVENPGADPARYLAGLENPNLADLLVLTKL